jgi:predicted DNA-binding protein with PD1-like motif
MTSKLIREEKNETTYVLAFDVGDEVIATITKFAGAHRIEAARMMAIGGLREATLGFFELGRKQYKHIEVQEQVEVVSLLGNIAMDMSGSTPQIKVHSHAVVGRSDGSTQAGHLIRGVVRPTLEMFLVANEARLEKHFDPATGLSLFRL